MNPGVSPKQTEPPLPAINAAPSRNVDRTRAPGVVATALVGVFSIVLSGCEGVPTRGEIGAQQALEAVGEAYRPGHQRPRLPRLRANGRLITFLQFAILNQPQVEAAYYDWAATVQRITVERSLPDPRLTFESDISNMVLSLMPGLMMDFPGPGKLTAAANVATAESEVKYFAFESSVLQTAFAVKKAYYQLHLVNGKIAVNQETLKLLADLEQIARAQNEAGKVTLQDVLRTQIEQERLATAIKNLKDSRNLLMAEFKAALGLKETDAMPPVPARFESTPLSLTSDRVLTFALTHNPRLKAMEAEVRRADAAIQLAHLAQVPDVLARIKADAMASPTVVTPEIWHHTPCLARQDRGADRRSGGREAGGGGPAIGRADRVGGRVRGEVVHVPRGKSQSRAVHRAAPAEGSAVAGSGAIGLRRRQGGVPQCDRCRADAPGLPAVDNRGPRTARARSGRTVAASSSACRRQRTGVVVRRIRSSGGRSMNTTELLQQIRRPHRALWWWSSSSVFPLFLLIFPSESPHDRSDGGGRAKHSAVAGTPAAVPSDATSGKTAARKIIGYRSTMLPGEVSSTPRKDSMGMDMMPVYAAEGSMLELSEHARAMASVETVPVQPPQAEPRDSGGWQSAIQRDGPGRGHYASGRLRRAPVRRLYRRRGQAWRSSGRDLQS